MENTNVTNYVLRIISRLLATIKDKEEKIDIMNKVCNKLSNRPNSKHDQLWLQNMTYERDLELKKCPYDMPLCKLVMEEDALIWNNDWIKSEFSKNLPLNSVVNKDLLKEIVPIVSF